MSCDPVLRAAFYGAATFAMFALLVVVVYWFVTGEEIPR